MESDNYSSAYLLSEDQNSFLLNSSEDGLHDNFSVEHIFTQVDSSDWRTDSFPVLLTNSLVSEENVEYENTAINENNIQLFTEKHLQSQSVLNQDEIEQPLTNDNVISTNNLILSDDILLQISDDEIPAFQMRAKEVRIIKQTDGMDNTTYITYMPNVQAKGLDKQTTNLNDNVIQLINDKGNMLTLDKSKYIVQPPRLEKENNPNEVNYKEFYTEVNALKCKICTFLCETVNDIKVHMLEKHPEKVKIPEKKQCLKKLITKMTSILNANKSENKKTLFLCSVCKNSYHDKEELKSHMINDHKLISSKQENSEAKDESSAENKNDVKSVRMLSELLIKKQQKSLRRVKCTIKGCTSRFAKDELRKRHEACHVGENKKQFQCPECQEKFSIWRICSSHLWKCHKIDMGLLTCPMCNAFKAPNAFQLLKHMDIHNDEKPFLCSECGNCFKQLTQLKNHEAIHNKGKDNVPNWSTMKQCEICDRFFANSKSYRKHVLFVHEKFKPFICNICGHKTARKEMLQLHIRQHTGAKPHHCQQCDYKTGDHNSLRRHLMRHVGGTKYSCPHCNYTCIQSSALKNHISTRHPGKSGNFKCTYCSYSTVNNSLFVSHLKYHEIALQKTNTNNGGTALNQNNLSASTQHVSHNKTDKTDNITLDVEDDETQNCFLYVDNTEDTIDTGGITIPAGLELPLQVS